MIATGIRAIGWSTLFLTVIVMAIVALYLMMLVLLSAVAPGAFT